MDQGFDEFFGFTNAIHAWEKFPKELWDGREVKPVERLRRHALHRPGASTSCSGNKDEPFFLLRAVHRRRTSSSRRRRRTSRRFKGKFPEKDPNKPLNATYAAMVTGWTRRSAGC